MENLIEIQDVVKRFGEQTVLDHVSLSVTPGKIYGIIGRNGSGKTVLFKSICGFVLPDAGKILVRGKQVGKDVDIPQGIGIIIEHPGFLRDYSGFQNLKLLARLQKKITDEKIKESIRLVGLDPEDKKKVGKFSLGMRQRLGIAQAIMESPDILILDEPINGLDPVGIKEFRQMIKRLNDELGMTILISSHILSELYLVANRFGIVDQGRLIKEISKAEFEEQGEDYIILKTSQLALASQLIQDQLHHRIKVIDKDGEINIFGQTHDIKVIVKALVQADIDVDEIYYARQDLEKFFTDLVD